MILLTIAFALFFITYNWLMFNTFGPIWSISEGFYHLKRKQNGSEWIFTIFLYVMAGYMAVMSMMTNQVLFFLSAIGAAFVGAAAAYEERISKSVHYIGSAILISAGAAGCWVQMGNWWVVVSIAVAGIAMIVLWKKINNPLYWFELFSSAAIILGIVT